MSNFKSDPPKYKEPEPLKQNWHYIGDGKFHDPTTNSSDMKGKWTIDYGYGSGKSYNKFQESLNKNG